jgi:Methyltransferase FkbM domain
MSDFTTRLAGLCLHHNNFIATLRRIPVLGGIFSWGSRKLLPKGTMAWVQIEQGHARGLWICVNPRTGQHVLSGSRETALQDAPVEYLEPGMTFYNVGANIGFFSLLAARIVGPFGRVVSFEADPEIAAERVVWSEPTTVFFVRSDTSMSPDRGLGHVAVDGYSSNTIAVPTVALDDFLGSDRPLDLIKSDVEGAEAAVFSGAENLLREKRPVLLTEMYNCRDLDGNCALAVPR